MVKYDEMNFDLVPMLWNVSAWAPIENDENTKRHIGLFYMSINWDFSSNDAPT